MPQSNKINVVVYPVRESDLEPLSFEGVNYISFVSSPGGAGEGTYGIPALISDHKAKSEGLPLRVLYVNPASIVAMEAERTA